MSALDTHGGVWSFGEFDAELYPSPEFYRQEWIANYGQWAGCDEEEATEIWDECEEQDTLDECMWCACGEHGHEGNPYEHHGQVIHHMTIEDQHDRAIEHITSIPLVCEEAPPRYDEVPPPNYPPPNYTAKPIILGTPEYYELDNYSRYLIRKAQKTL
jgi:hypothetical protein